MGRIDATRLPLLPPDFGEREVFCCGPEPFMRAVRQMPEAVGFDMACCHQESFAAPALLWANRRMRTCARQVDLLHAPGWPEPAFYHVRSWRNW